MHGRGRRNTKNKKTNIKRITSLTNIGIYYSYLEIKNQVVEISGTLDWGFNILLLVPQENKERQREG